MWAAGWWRVIQSKLNDCANRTAQVTLWKDHHLTLRPSASVILPHSSTHTPLYWKHTSLHTFTQTHPVINLRALMHVRVQKRRSSLKHENSRNLLSLVSSQMYTTSFFRLNTKKLLYIYHEACVWFYINICNVKSQIEHQAVFRFKQSSRFAEHLKSGSKKAF